MVSPKIETLSAPVRALEGVQRAGTVSLTCLELFEQPRYWADSHQFRPFFCYLRGLGTYHAGGATPTRGTLSRGHGGVCT